MTLKSATVLNHKFEGTDGVLKGGEFIKVLLELDKRADITLGINIRNTETEEVYNIFAHIIKQEVERDKVLATLKARIPFHLESGKYKTFRINIYEKYVKTGYLIELADGVVLDIEKI